MHTTLTNKGQVTIPKKIRDALDLQPGCKIIFVLTESGDLVLQKADVHPSNMSNKNSNQLTSKDKFEKVRGRADIEWRTEDLMSLLRGDH